MREVLLSFGVQQLVSSDCPLCGGGIESINHLFLHCTRSNEVWRISMGWWGVSSCTSSSVGEWAVCWNNLCPSMSRRRAWNTLFFAVIWSIWECRNEVVFCGKVMDLGVILDTIKFRVALWFKNHGCGSNVDLTFLILDVNDRCVDIPAAKVKKVSSWSPPSDFELSFNVDGSAKGSRERQELVVFSVTLVVGFYVYFPLMWVCLMLFLQKSWPYIEHVS